MTDIEPTPALRFTFWDKVALELMCLRSLRFDGSCASPDQMLASFLGTQYGSGFLWSQDDRTWLVTCAHNIESRERNFLGVPDRDQVTIVQRMQESKGGLSVLLNDGRAVLYARVADTVVDLAAIELRPHEIPAHAIIHGHEALPVGDPVAEHEVASWNNQEGPFRIGQALVDLPRCKYLIVGNDSGLDANAQRALQAFGLPGLPTIGPHAISYLGTTYHGFSGGPVLAVSNDGLTVVGVHTHSCPFTFPLIGQTDQGGQATSSMVMRAMLSLAPEKGIHIVEVTLPTSCDESGSTAPDSSAR